MEGFDYNWERIPREGNGRADALAKLASIKATVNNRTIIQEALHTPCVEDVMSLEAKPS